MAFVRTYPDGAIVEVLRCRYLAPMQSEKVWMPGVIVKLMQAPSMPDTKGPIIQESYLISFTDGSNGQFPVGHIRLPTPKKQAGRSVFPKKAKGK